LPELLIFALISTRLSITWTKEMIAAPAILPPSGEQPPEIGKEMS
jgi:hypothetical protein